ncbi:hypothetical protein HMPREF1990_01181 [Porphyromonas gingivalis W4087]|uniref:protein-export chaperone SecB n=1 Tax=Porphyromonas gingivalis TaxID=837 RepID=UPI0003AD74D7|nr:protein-export chaperone SecB [Porphyromonas gingivalis]ERJ81854.1 hypothetical protein HMPREF1989_02299 [Porphyromonas gingivalis F0566]ERJ88751.1 hypothetical protein HMPREF1990_01181 [Porphyromonas gingivalis W4087]PDP63345.1 protein export chaperone secb [Porphyromonas gingivalis]PDP76058.1 protein export chaperone secb [Porphyromonas gingivalis]
MSENNVMPARFRFVKYLITEASIKLTGRTLGKDVQFGIHPDGELKKEEKIFLLIMKVLIKDDENNLDFSMSIEGVFEYEIDDLQELIPFICENAPAILFPYIRAYISNITALSGMSPIILPTLNIKRVGEELIDKINTAN